MAQTKEKEVTKADRCKVILANLERRRDDLEEGYLTLLETGGGVVTKDAIDQLDHLQEIDEHIAEMQKQIKSK